MQPLELVDAPAGCPAEPGREYLVHAPQDRRKRLAAIGGKDSMTSSTRRKAEASGST